MKQKCEKSTEQANKAGSNKISIRNDLAKDGMVFSEESSRAKRWDARRGADRDETNLGNYSMSFLPEARINVASCYDPIKVRWTESEQHSKHWKHRTNVLHQPFQEEGNVVKIHGNIKPETH